MLLIRKHLKWWSIQNCIKEHNLYNFEVDEWISILQYNSIFVNFK